MEENQIENPSAKLSKKKIKFVITYKCRNKNSFISIYWRISTLKKIWCKYRIKLFDKVLNLIISVLTFYHLVEETIL